MMYSCWNTLSRIYNVASLMDDLRQLYRTAGTGSKGLTFIFTDNEIKEEAFLEYINNVLSVGEVANLFPKDELDDILTTVTPLMKKDDPRRPLTQENLYDYFISRARNNLHIILCFSPVSFFGVALSKHIGAHLYYSFLLIYRVNRSYRSVKSSDLER